MSVRISALVILTVTSLAFSCGTAPKKISISSKKTSYSSANNDGRSDDLVTGGSGEVQIPETDPSGGDKSPGSGEIPETDTEVMNPENPVGGSGEMPLACKTFKWESIKKPEDATCFTSIPEAFAALPEYVRSFWILMKKSRSAQASSLEAPRIIISSPDGSFLIGAATDPDARQDLEVAVYDYEKNEWQFAGIDFSSNPPKVEKELCKSCHGSQPHPIWTSYGFWTGAFAAGNTLAADEADFLKRVVSGADDVPPLLKSLKLRSASNYQQGRRLAPATPYYGGEENGQVLNYVTMQKAAQATVARIQANPTVTTLDMLEMSTEISCKTRSGALQKFGFSINKDLSFALEGVDRSGDMFNGRFSSSLYLAAELMGKALERDPSLKDKLPAAAKAFADSRYRYFKTKSLAEHMSYMATARTSLRSLMSNYLNDVIGGAIKSTAHCSAVKSLIEQNSDKESN